MNTSIRKGQTTFFGDSVFPHGISRSGYFNKRESEELAVYGKTFEGLCSGALAPQNEEEIQFIEAINTSTESTLGSVLLWRKYLTVLENSRIHHGFSMSNGKTKYVNENDLSLA